MPFITCNSNNRIVCVVTLDEELLLLDPLGALDGYGMYSALRQCDMPTSLRAIVATHPESPHRFVRNIGDFLSASAGAPPRLFLPRGSTNAEIDTECALLQIPQLVLDVPRATERQPWTTDDVRVAEPQLALPEDEDASNNRSKPSEDGEVSEDEWEDNYDYADYDEYDGGRGIVPISARVLSTTDLTREGPCVAQVREGGDGEGSIYLIATNIGTTRQWDMLARMHARDLESDVLILEHRTC